MSAINKDLERQFTLFLFNDRKLDEKRRRHIEGIVKRLLAYFRTKKFNRGNFNEYVEYLKKKKLSNGTINQYIAFGKNLDRFLKTNELQGYSYFKQERMVVDMLSPDEIQSLAEIKIEYKIRKDYLNNLYKNLIYFLATTGCRIEEALSLRKSDILSNPPLVIFRDTKNGEQRIVPIISWLHKNLLSLSPNGIVFLSSQNSQLHPDTVNLELKRRAKECAINKRVFCHLFRHSYITEMRRRGVSLSDIARLVGHKDIKSTMHYDHYVIDDLIHAAYQHPLLAGQQTLDMIATRLKNNLNFVNKMLFLVKVEENSERFAITLEKL